MSFAFERFFRVAGYYKRLDFMRDREWHGNKHVLPRSTFFASTLRVIVFITRPEGGPIEDLTPGFFLFFPCRSVM